MPIYTEVETTFKGEGSRKIFEWAQDGDRGVFFARVFGYDYANATEDDWDSWGESVFNSYRLSNMDCEARMNRNKSVTLYLKVIGSIPFGVFSKIAALFPQIHADGRYIQQSEAYFGNIVIENGGFLWTQFDNPRERSGNRDFWFDSFFESEKKTDMNPVQKDVLALLKFDRDNMRSLLAEGTGYFKFKSKKKRKQFKYNSDFYFSDLELRAIAGDADSQFQIATEIHDSKFIGNNPKVYLGEPEPFVDYLNEMYYSWLRKAAMNGNPDAQYQIARDLLDGKEAKELFLFSLKNGSKEAFKEGESEFGFGREERTVIEIMANQGSVDAIWALINHFKGDIDYIDGTFIYPNRDKKNYVKWLNKAIDYDVADAMWLLAKYYLDEKQSQSDIDKAIALLERASSLGHGTAANKLARMYAKGELVEKDIHKALKHYEVELASGDSLWDIEGAKYLFACSEMGLYAFPSDTDREMCRSTLSGSYELADCFGGEDEIAKALGIIIDSEKYIKWLNIAAKKGSGGAMFRLGKAYYEGMHIGQDFKKAFEFFLRSSNKKENYDDESHYYLGKMYMNGEYVPENIFMAERWLRLGSINQNSVTEKEKAKEQLELVRSRIKKEQLVADKDYLARMKDFEKAVLLIYRKQYDKAIEAFHKVGDYLDSLQRLEDTVSLYSQMFDKLLSKRKYVVARKSLDLIPRDTDELNKLWKKLNTKLKQKIKNRKFVVGDIGPAGGTIVYVKESASDGWQYMESASSAVSYRLWGKNGTIGTERGIGFGKENTYKIVAANKGEETAAQACLDYEQNGYNDWFLPSIDELSLLILPEVSKEDGYYDRCKYCDEHLGTRKVTSSSEADELKTLGLKLKFMQEMSWSKDVISNWNKADFPMKCIPFRVF